MDSTSCSADKIRNFLKQYTHMTYILVDKLIQNGNETEYEI